MDYVASFLSGLQAAKERFEFINNNYLVPMFLRSRGLSPCTVVNMKVTSEMEEKFMLWCTLNGWKPDGIYRRIKGGVHGYH